MTSGDGRLRVEVLGPLRVLDATAGDVTPVGTLQRRLLALLVLHRGRVTSTDAAIDALWPGRRPADPMAALQNHVSRLRHALPEAVIESVGDGYRVDPARVDVDADLVAHALNARAEGVAWTEVDVALERWRGPAYPDLDDVDDGRAEALRLEELRSRAREVRAEVRLADGDTDGLVAELAALVEAGPLRERPRALLMTALDTAGRHAEAMRVYDDFRRLLGEQLGTEPSPALAAAHTELLHRASPPTWTPASRLPVAAASLVGRDELAAEVTTLADSSRLLTLVGPGGVGKTRLLVEISHRLVALRPDRPVVMCELAAADARTAVDVVAAALGVDSRPGVPLASRLAEALGDTEVVLLLDNCEHLLDPIAELVDLLLGRCAGVQVMATSRERLRSPGERVQVVPTLATDDEAAPATELFLERARAVAPGFAPDGATLAAVAEVVRRLDGLPLAIELAAARLLTHDLGEVAAGLDHRFSLLSSGYRTTGRHQSLSAAVSWSFGLLDDDLADTFADLSVFGGSFTVDDVTAVSDTGDRPTAAVLDELVERSLVMRAPGRRYTLLETLRAFGHERLMADGRAEDVRRRHAHHQVRWVEAADRRLLEPGRPILAELDAAVPELRTALGWLLDHDEVEPAGRLVSGLLGYGFLRLRPDVLAWSERVTDADPEDLCPSAASVWVAAAYAAWMAGDVAETGVRAARARRLGARAGGIVASQVFTISGSHQLFLGRLDEAAAWYRRAVVAAEGIDPALRLLSAGSEVLALGYAGRPEAEERATVLLAEVAGASTAYAAYAWYCAGEAALAVDVELARSRLVRALEVAEVTHASFVTGIAGASKASIDARLGDAEGAAEDYRRLILHWQRAGMWSTQWTMMRSIAALLERLGRHREAAVLEGAVRSTDAGHRIFGADAVALSELAARLRHALGDEAYRAARDEGAKLDGGAVVEHALRSL